MKITRIRIFKTPLPYVGGTYGWGAGNAITTAMASVVVIDTDAGLQGCGEFTPCGENYMVAHSEGVEALARLIARPLLGEDPRQVAGIERAMDEARMVSSASRGISPRSHWISQTASSTSSQRRYFPSSDQISLMSGRE